MEKPGDLFDREREWQALDRFLTERGRFGVVYGRRRQGKSFLLERFAEKAKGAYFEALEGTARQQLDDFAQHFAAAQALPSPPRFESWRHAFDAVWQAAPRLLILDEFQYLVAASPELPSLLQARVSRRGGPSIIVCGSALGAMRALLGSDAALRGRASLELVLAPFDYRTAARYWRLAGDQVRAFELHALVGGTPAYLDFAAGRSPAEFVSLAAWASEVLLNPAGALFREGRILADEPTLHDRGLYRGILAAVAGGATRRGQIGTVLGRPDNTLAHPLDALVDLALLERVDDPLHRRRSFYRLADPMLRTHQLLIAPNEGAIERRGAARVWPSLAGTVSSRIYGPHFEHLAREWLATHASEESLGGTPRVVGPSIAHDPRGKRELEVDAVATSGEQVLALGEAKWTTRKLGPQALTSLVEKRGLLGARAQKAKLFVFGSAGFEPTLRSAARKLGGVELVDLDRMYRGR